MMSGASREKCPPSFSAVQPRKKAKKDTATSAPPDDKVGKRTKRRKAKKGKKGARKELPAKEEMGALHENEYNAACEGLDVATIIEALNEGHGGSLSDKLNPDHPHFDAALKAAWKYLPKRSRRTMVAADLARIAAVRERGDDALRRLPFPNEADDHCESPPEAYADIAAVLDLIALKLGKTRATLVIYDPYYCAGAMRTHLGSLGFGNVLNAAVDFYATLRDEIVPPHDVVVTNPPYSGNHVEKLLDFCGGHDRPYLLLMPNYFCRKDFYLPALFRAALLSTRGEQEKPPPMFICPAKRYNYWTPKSMRPKGKVQGHSSVLGHRTSPFVSFWYVCTEPAVPRSELMEMAKSLKVVAGGRSPPSYCATYEALPSGVRPGLV